MYVLGSRDGPSTQMAEGPSFGGRRWIRNRAVNRSVARDRFRLNYRALRILIIYCHSVVIDVSVVLTLLNYAGYSIDVQHRPLPSATGLPKTARACHDPLTQQPSRSPARERVPPAASASDVLSKSAPRSRQIITFPEISQHQS